MKVVVQRAPLLKALSHVQSVVERRNTIPILANVLLEAQAGRLSLTATDLDIEIVESVTAETKAEGAATAPVHTLYEIVRRLPDGVDVEIDTAGEDSRLKVRAGTADFALQSLSAEDFPALDDQDLTTKFVMDGGEFASLIDRCRFAMSTEETRYYLNGVFLHPLSREGEGDALRAVATDGHRLARVDVALPEGADAMPGVIIPRKTIGEVRKLLGDREEAGVEISVSEAKIRFSFDRLVLTSKLIDGTFPDYARVIPEGNPHELSVDAKGLSKAVDRVAIVSSERSRAVKFHLGNDKLRLTVDNPDTGQGVEEVAVSYSGEPFDIGFNAKYLLDILSQIEESAAVLQLSDAASPTLIHDADNDAALYVLMPMRV